MLWIDVNNIQKHERQGQTASPWGSVHCSSLKHVTWPTDERQVSTWAGNACVKPRPFYLRSGRTLSRVLSLWGWTSISFDFELRVDERSREVSVNLVILKLYRWAISSTCRLHGPAAAHHVSYSRTRCEATGTHEGEAWGIALASAANL